MTLEDYSIENMEAEIARRKRAKQALPERLPVPNIDKLRDMVDDYIEDIIAKDYEDDDWEHYIYEGTMVAFYGDAIWNWFKERTP